MEPIFRTSGWKLAALLGLSVLGCLPAVKKLCYLDPVKAPGQMWERLEALRSFRFRLKYHTDSPFVLGAEFTGSWSTPDRESWKGYRQRFSERSSVELLAAGSRQYERSDTGWFVSARGLETRIMEQARQVLVGSEPVLVETLARRLRYRLEPSLPILDPALAKKFTAWLDVDRSTGLPLVLSAEDAAATASWRLTLDRFNRAGQVRIPFVLASEAVIAPGERLSERERRQAYVGLAERLKRLGWEHRFGRSREGPLLQLGAKTSRQLLELALSSGDTRLWSGQGMQDSLAGDSLRVVFVGGDAARRVVLEKLLARNGDFEARLELEHLPEPRLCLDLKDTAEARLGPDDSLVVLVVDGKALASVRAQAGAALTFSELGTADYLRVLVGLANGLPLAAGFRIVSLR